MADPNPTPDAGGDNLLAGGVTFGDLDEGAGDAFMFMNQSNGNINSNLNLHDSDLVNPDLNLNIMDAAFLDFLNDTAGNIISSDLNTGNIHINGNNVPNVSVNTASHDPSPLRDMNNSNNSTSISTGVSTCEMISTMLGNTNGTRLTSNNASSNTSTLSNNSSGKLYIIKSLRVTIYYRILKYLR